MSLSAFLDCPCGRRWRAFKGAGLPMQAPRYSPPQGSLSTRPDSRALAADLLLTLWHRPRCPECHQPHTPCHRRQPWTRNPAAYHSLAPSSWYPVPAGICERRRESSISWAIQACKLVCLPGVTLEKDRETWLLACNSAWFWGACYSARPFRLGYSFVAWHLYCGLAFEVFGCGKGSASTRSSILGAWRIVLPRFSILSGDQGFLCKKPEDNIRSWDQKAYSRCWHFWRCCRQTQPLV